MSKSDCNDLITKTCNTRDECCHGLLACNYNQFLCASNITMTCRGLRCEAELENRVCCPLNSRVCSVLNYCYIYTIQICLSLFFSVVSQEGDSNVVLETAKSLYLHSNFKDFYERAPSS